MKSNSWRLRAIAAFSLASAFVPALSAQAATFTVVHTFTGGSDGANPLAGLTVDSSGNLYGTASSGGAGYGTAFEVKHLRASWKFEVLYSFGSGADGANPMARVIAGPQGLLYGTASQGGGGGGTVFDLSALPKNQPRKELSLYRFVGSGNGYEPSSGDLTFDAAGNIYGTTTDGGAYGGGTVFKLTRSHGTWGETILYSFGGIGDGATPVSGVIRDVAGNLYGTTSAGGSSGNGTVFELTSSGSSWKENVLHDFAAQNDGSVPYAGLTFDASGRLYGAATQGGTNGGGTIFVLRHAKGGWAFKVVYSVPGWGISGPFRTPLVDASGNVFGTTHCDGAYSAGSVFELVRSGNSWTYNSLYDFTGGADGQFVFSNPVFDSHGNVYGTTQVGGSGYGVIWEVSP